MARGRAIFLAMPRAISSAPIRPFRNWVTADGAPGPTGAGGFHAAAGRYHLIVSLACPWAHRTLIFRKLKGLESMISLSVVNWLMAERGWTFDAGPGVIPDPLFGFETLSSFYVKARPDFTGRVTVPVLWDKEYEHDRQQRVVRNHPDVQFRLRRYRRGRGRLLPGGLEARDRRPQRPHLRDRQQRRLSRGLRDFPGGLRGGVPRACSRRWIGWRRGSRAGGSCAASG